ncbi:MAG: hypothetical protein DRR19_03180 [Candidatus Parabeggiatoa sp. nov. 1]|nr:MAG: hypothetical protein DRR19_03180 [Gammaproteobacteria bacterium]
MQKFQLLIRIIIQPIEFILCLYLANDCKILKEFNLELPEGSIIYGDKAYNDYEYEDILKEAVNIFLKP